MRPVPTDGGGFLLEQVSESELAALRHVATDADASTCKEARARLYPRGFSGGGTADDDSDWEEFVHPDLETLFTDDVVRCARDLDAASCVGETYTVTVSAENAERWFRALNQARLVMHERHTFPDEAGLAEDEHMAAITALLQTGDFAPYLRSRLYGELQEWIVAFCLKY